MQGVVITSAANEKNIWQGLVQKNGLKYLVMTPSPVEADKRRLKLNEWGLSASFDVITSAKFLSSKIDSLDEIKKKYKFFKKSELLFHLGILYHQTHPAPTILNFENSYKWFSELRSFSVDFNVLSSVIDDLPEEIAQTIRIFQYYFESHNILDEHMAFHLLNNEFENIFKDDEKIIFSDFINLTGVQVDLLKKIIEKGQVGIIVPDIFLYYKNNFDWIHWLQIEEPQSREILSSGDIKVYHYEKGNLQNYLDDLFNSEKFKKVMFLTGDDQFQSHVLSLPKHFFKRSIDLFYDVIAICFKDFKSWIEIKKINQFEFLRQVETELNNIIKTKSNIDNLYYRKIKILQLVVAEINLLKELFSREIIMDQFILSLIEKIITLDVPRASLIPLIENEGSELFNLKEINFKGPSNNFIAFAEDFVSAVKNQDLPFALTQKLAILGPLKNKSLEMANFIYNLSDPLIGETVILIPEDFKESSPYLNKLMDDPVFLKAQKERLQGPEVKIQTRTNADPLDEIVLANLKLKKMGHTIYGLSAIKSYKECPRKYFFNYVLKFDKKVAIDNILSPIQLGELEHRTIGAFFTRYPDGFGGDDFQEILFRLVDDNIRSFIDSNKLLLSDADKFKALNEIYHYSKNAILFIQKIIESMSHPKLHFELPFTHPLFSGRSVNGRIDCVIECSNFAIVIDFKRSKGASKAEILNMADLQIGTYLLATTSLLHKTIEAFNYIILNDESSTLLRFQDSAQEITSEVKIDVLKINQLDYYNNLKSELEKIIDEIIRDDLFLPRPTVDACLYCGLKSICKRGQA